MSLNRDSGSDEIGARLIGAGIDRITLARRGASHWQVEARNGAWWAMGEICETPEHAIRSACAAFDAERAKVKALKPDPFEGLLG
ncbi:hypothetical protein [Gemmobacter lutimaris]|jgi:hypothetical protein|uniref:hypothetical protein n=1 Tax=Gemmobacter lutimaris TaxID=2306023 RepID=UPI0011C3C86B|nr:hypothetical protein [Gemmobacter lutimaris]